MQQERSRSIFQRACTLIPGGVNSPVRAFRSVGLEPFVVSHAAGAYLIDVDGNRYIDYINSWGPLVLGHAHPAVTEALVAQASKGTSFGACSALEVELAEFVTSKMPSLEMLRFVNSGTEAGMSVVRLARAFTKRSKIVKFTGCYHGHFDSMLVQAGSGVATLGLPDCVGVLPTVTQDTITVPFNDASRVEEVFAKFGNEIAAVLLEPVVGNAGLLLPEKGYLEALRSITEQYSALLIFDEVMTGFRVDLQGAQTLFGVRPDLTMLGKVIGGGLPVGAFGGRADIMKLIAPSGPVYQAGTLSGNPLAMVAGLATLREWYRPGRFEQTASYAKRLADHMQASARIHKIPFVATSIGSMFGFFFQDGPVRSYEDAKRSDIESFKKFFSAMLERGVFFAPSQFEAGFVSTAHRDEEFLHTCRAIDEVFATLV